MTGMLFVYLSLQRRPGSEPVAPVDLLRGRLCGPLPGSKGPGARDHRAGVQLETGRALEQGSGGADAADAGDGESYGVRNPYSVTDNLSGGVQYLADLLRRFNGEMRLAVAAYYCGSRPLDAAVSPIATPRLSRMSKPCKGGMSGRSPK